MTLPLKTLKYLFLFLFAGIAFQAFSQEPDTIIPVKQNPEKLLRKIDVRKITQNGFNFWYDDFSGHWAGVDFGFNTFVNKDYTGYNFKFMDNDVFLSNSTFINFFQQSIGVQHNRNTIGLVTGLGLHLQSYRLNQSTSIQRGENDVIEPITLYFDQNQKSKLSIISATVPLLAEFQIPLNDYKNRVYISAGIYGSYRINSHTKIKYRIDHKKEKLKVPDHYSLQDFRYGIMLRTGYRRINLFATYDLVPLFKSEKGPELTPFTFGFTVLSF
jgi:hypothetical protein